LQERLSLPQYERGAFEDYRLRVNDEIVFRLLTNDLEMSRIYPSGVASATGENSYRIASDGTIDVPFMHRIHIEGLTLKEATEVLENRFKEIIPDAVVRMAMRTKNFTVIGDVGTGVFPLYKDRLTIYQALALAGDLHQSGDRQRITILRETNDGIQRLEFDIRPRSVIESEFYYVYPNDIIYVRKLPASFYKVGTYAGFIGLVNMTVTFFNTILIYTQIMND
jgi:polysaccharide export outer membrane protein